MENDTLSFDHVLESSVDGELHFGLHSSSGILNKIQNITLRKLVVFPSSGGVVDPLEIVNLNHWTTD
jgi:hypothetical protein